MRVSPVQCPTDVSVSCTVPYIIWVLPVQCPTDVSVACAVPYRCECCLYSALQMWVLPVQCPTDVSVACAVPYRCECCLCSALQMWVLPVQCPTDVSVACALPYRCECCLCSALQMWVLPVQCPTDVSVACAVPYTMQPVWVAPRMCWRCCCRLVRTWMCWTTKPPLLSSLPLSPTINLLPASSSTRELMCGRKMVTVRVIVFLSYLSHCQADRWGTTVHFSISLPHSSRF